MGKTPSYGHVQSVLSHIWGRGMKLEIHLRSASRSMLVRKIVEQEIWHIGSFLFYVAQWSSDLAISPPSFTSILLWAHIRGIPLDLYSQKGLGQVADLIGLPVEVDEFTRRMTSLEVAHIKVKVDCTKPLPDAAEIERENGEIVRIFIDYPWTPPICPCCKEMGHLETMCLNAKWNPKDNQAPTQQGSAAPTSLMAQSPLVNIDPTAINMPVQTLEMDIQVQDASYP